jgi:hypothetical protein
VLALQVVCYASRVPCGGVEHNLKDIKEKVQKNPVASATSCFTGVWFFNIFDNFGIDRKRSDSALVCV